MQSQTNATKEKSSHFEHKETILICPHWIWLQAQPVPQALETYSNMYKNNLVDCIPVRCVPRDFLNLLPGGWCRLGGLSLHTLCSAQKVFPHRELHLSGDVRRCLAYFNGCLQEAHRCQRIFFLLSRHSDLGMMRTRQKRRLLKRGAVVGGEGRRTWWKRFFPPRNPTELPGDKCGK